MSDEPKRWWIRRCHDRNMWEGFDNKYNGFNKEFMIEVQEVPKPKKKKLYAYLIQMDCGNFRMVYSPDEDQIVILGFQKNERPVMRIPSQDIEVDE